MTDTKSTVPVERLGSLSDLITPMAIRVAATLKLPDLIADGVTTAGALADRTHTDRDALGRLLRHLTSIGLLRPAGSDFCLTELGEALRSAHPGSPTSSLDINGIVGRISLAQLRLLDSIRTGQAAYPLVYGRGFWEDLATDPDLSARFDAHMGSGDPSAAVAAYDWAAARWVVDVGGGNGNLLPPPGGPRLGCPIAQAPDAGASAALRDGQSAIPHPTLRPGPWVRRRAGTAPIEYRASPPSSSASRGACPATGGAAQGSLLRSASSGTRHRHRGSCRSAAIGPTIARARRPARRGR
jgi:hypothetical protein